MSESPDGIKFESDLTPGFLNHLDTIADTKKCLIVG